VISCSVLLSPALRIGQNPPEMLTNIQIVMTELPNPVEFSNYMTTG
jgi:hypothetical protein